MPLFRSLLVLLASARLAFGSAPGQAEETAAADADALAAWHDASLSLFQNAHARFRSASGPEARLGRALTLLVLQPKTAGNLDQAERLLRALVDDPMSAEFAPAALYHLGRIEQLHRPGPAPAAAREHYRRLVSSYPESDYAALATVKLAIIDLYEPVPPDVRRARFEALRAVAPALRPAFARRDLGLLLADVAGQFGYGDELVLESLLLAHRAGVARPAEQADVRVRIAEHAARLGRFDLAREHYLAHLSDFPRDNRRRMIEERLAGLPASAP